MLERRDHRLLQRVLGEVEVAEDADEGGEDRSRLAAEDQLDVGLRRRSASHLHDGTDLDGAGAGAGDLAGQLDGPVEILDVDEVVAAEDFLRLGERAVGRGDAAVAHPHGGGRVDAGWSWSPPTISPDSRIDCVNDMYSACMASRSAGSEPHWVRSSLISRMYFTVPPGSGSLQHRRTEPLGSTGAPRNSRSDRALRRRAGALPCLWH